MSILKSVDDALQAILAGIRPLSSENVPLLSAFGRTLAADIYAPLDLPPFANSAVDGYAAQSADTTPSPVTLTVVMDIPAGTWPQQTLQAGQAARIMTGAPVPHGADTVIPVEDTDADWGTEEARLSPTHITLQRAARVGDNVRPAGENVRAGQLLLHAGTVLRPQDIGMLASVGMAHAPVTRQPRVALLSSGDELLMPGQPLSAGKIYDANSFTLAGLIAQVGGLPMVMPPASDTLESVRALFQAAIDAQPDVIVSSAGVSVGAADFVRGVLGEKGRVDFWRINLRPGKPLAYGHVQGVPFFGLPGNPVSAMVTFDVVVRPALLKMLGQADNAEQVRAITAEDIHSDGRRSYLRVTLERVEGRLMARLTGTQSSGALMSMVLADGLMIVPQDVTFVPAGTELTVRLLRDHL